MSRIQKRRQGAKETPSSGDRDEENDRVGGGDVGMGKRELGGENVTGRGRRERNRDIEDEKPKSDDEDDGRRKKDDLKLKIDPPADLKQNLNTTEEDKPFSRNIGKPPRGGGLTDKITNPLQEGKDGNNGGGDADNSSSEIKQLEKDLEKGPLKILQPLRTDPLGAMKNRYKKLERLTAESIPEIHFIGKILSGEHIVMDISEGGTCR
jgi:hypothetical protein